MASLAAGARLGGFEILGSLGAGGMGEVYRARDTQLKREVAIKVLPDAFTQDPERVARFQREAEILAAINHPNIAAIYGLEVGKVGPAEAGPYAPTGDGQTGVGSGFSRTVRALVMELVEGPTLAERIVERGVIPLDDALAIAKQIGEALEAAHEHGIIHRDLKPSNIKVTPDGAVKVLDFGLAKAMGTGPVEAGHHDREGPIAGERDLTAQPTITTPAMTRMGVILGTAAYMSPEQARGRTADRRSDVWSFGCVLYEMLTGRRAFPGDDLSDTLAAVIKSEPDWTALPAATPPSIRRLVRRCLVKDRKARLGDASAIRIEVDDARSETAPDAMPMPRVVGHRERHRWAVAVGLLALTTIVALTWALIPSSASAPEMRLQVATPLTTAPLQFALSPDGRHLVFVASGDGSQRLWLRALDTVEARPMTDTEGASYPFWSADSRSVGFFAANKLLRIDITGGPPQALTAVPFSRGGAWNAEGTILFARTDASELSRVPATGGEPVAVTRLDLARYTAHRIPHFLPDGRRFLFFASGGADSTGIYLGSLDGGEPQRLTAADSAGAYLPSGWLLFVRQGTLVARRLDVERGELTSDPVTVADLVGYDTAASGAFSVAADGRIAYRSGGTGSRVLRWFDRTGKLLGAAAEPDEGDLLNPELSPDGRRVALTRTAQNVANVWLVDLARKGFNRFTFDAGSSFGIWSPDGQRIVFQRNRLSSFNMYVKPTSGVGVEATVLEGPNIKVPQDWSPDGRYLLYYEVDPKTARDVWALPMTGTDRKPRAVAKTPFDERHGQFSPDGRFVAYTTDESGRPEIVVQTFPEASGKWQVSNDGGIQPRWRGDGGEIYFIAPDGMMMAASARVDSKGSALDVGTPMALFPSRIAVGGTANFKPQYDVSKDGRFLVLQPTEEATASPITILLNWKPPNGD